MNSKTFTFYQYVAVLLLIICILPYQLKANYVSKSAEYFLEHMVVFLDKDGNTISSQKITDGDAATPPNAPQIQGHFFIGWLANDGTFVSDFNNISADINVTATYQQEMHPQVGDFYQGGTVFYVYKPGDFGYEPDKVKGLICAIDDISGGGLYRWATLQNSAFGFGGYYESISTSKEIGTGKINSEKIINWFGTPKSPSLLYYYAAYACQQWKHSGYNDWFLPSYNEMEEIWRQRKTINVVSVNNGGKLLDTVDVQTNNMVYYWTSSEKNSQQASALQIADFHANISFDKDQAYGYIRPVREFKYQRRTHTVTFKNYNGTVLHIDTVDYSYSATAPQQPQREGYSFAGWDIDFSHITADTTITATYNINSYTVSFVNYDGSPIKQQTVTYGSTATAPVVAARTGYTFAGWDVDFSNIACDITVTAQFENNSIVNYKVTFTDWDNTTISTQIVQEGGSATAPTAPTRDGYTFTGWNNNYNIITADASIRAQYSRNIYTVTFLDWDGTLLNTQSVSHGNAAIQPTPTQRLGFVFESWDEFTDSITASVTATAKYKQDLNYTPQIGDFYQGGIVYYTSEFNGNIRGLIAHTQDIGSYQWHPTDRNTYSTPLSSDDLYMGELNTRKIYEEFGAPLSNAPASNYAAYVCLEFAINGFSDWHLPSRDELNEVYLHKYKLDSASLSNAGTAIKNSKYWSSTSAGSMAYDPPSTWTSHTIDMTISDWKTRSKDYQLRGDVFFVRPIRYFSHPMPVYTVSFKHWDGSIMSTQQIKTGQDAIVPFLPKRPGGYTFRGWDKSAKNIRSNMVITPLYSQEGVTPHKVEFRDYNGKTLKVETVLEGNSATPPFTSNVYSDRYIFTGWAGNYTKIFQDEIVIARYTLTSQSYYNVIFKNYNDDIISWRAVKKNSTAIVPSAPNRTGYSFKGWFDENNIQVNDFSNITAHVTVKAQYQANAGNIYKVQFNDWNSVAINIQYIKENSAAVAPANPSRLGYTFTGWDAFFNTITSDLTITAQYTQDFYTVIFKDWDGTTISSSNISYGYGANPPQIPSRPGYTFRSWDNTYSNITADLTITALYDINKYTVTFKDWDGTILKTESVEYEKSTTAPANPVRSGYTFRSWDMDFSKVTKELIVTAQYTQNGVTNYTVTFKDWDGAVLKTGIVAQGQPATAPVNPVRTGYTFTGWDNAFTNVTTDLTITALYDINKYTVTFKDWDGTILKTESVEYEKSATAPANPTRPGYTFSSWDMDFSKVTKDLIVTAQYTQNGTTNYTVTFKDWDGTVLKTEIVVQGQQATAPANPSRAGYTFAGWDNAFTNVTTDLTITAQYDINKYTVTFKDGDGTILKTEIIDYGKPATAPANPTRSGYTFSGWDLDFSKVTKDLTVTALYTQDGTTNFTVTFKDWDGAVLKTEIVAPGQQATAPADPSRTGYTFSGWDKIHSNIISDLTVTAQYNINKYAVTFKDWDGTELKTETIDFGSSATAPTSPSRTGYTFAGWDKAFTNVTTDLTIAAQYDINKYTVTFKDWDGIVLKTELVEHGKSATPPSDPTRANYTFTGWDTDFSNITNFLTLTAQYSLVSGMENIKTDPLIKIYPNPVEDNLFIEVQDMNLIQNSEKGISVFNSTGIRICHSHNIKTKQIIDLSKYPKGLYFVNIGKETRKILVE